MNYNFYFTITFSAFFYSLDVYSLCFAGFFKQFRIKNIWLPLGIEPRITCLTHKRSATELRGQPAGKQTLHFCIYILLRLYFSIEFLLSIVKVVWFIIVIIKLTSQRRQY